MANPTTGSRTVEIRDYRQFVIDFVASRGTLRMDGNNQDQSEGVNLGTVDAAVVGGSYIYGLYFQTTDTYLFHAQDDKDLSTGGRAFYHAVYCHDAMCQNPDVGWWQPLTYNPRAGSSSQDFNYMGGTAIGRFIVGQPNMRTLEQSFYWFQSGEGWTNFKAHDCSIVDNDVWPNIGASMLINGAPDGATPGYWSSATGGGAGTRWHGIVFEGITDTSDGMPGETAPNTGMIRGSSTHPKGLGLFRSDEYNFEGTGTPSDEHDQTWLWVDIDTGLAVGVLGVFALSSSDSEQIWQQPSIDKHTGFFWDTVQFVPDVDSSYSRPKGELHFLLASNTAYTVNNRDIFDTDGSLWTPAQAQSQLFKVVDFNPFNETTGVERVHNRETEQGHVVIPHDPLLPGGSVSLNPGSGSRHDKNGSAVFYHPPSRSYVNTMNSYLDVSNNGVGQPGVDSHRIIRWPRDNIVQAVTIPAPDAAVIENGASYFDVYAMTELNEPVPNHTLYFQTFRASTRAETFDGTAQGASAYVVDNAVIDNDGFIDVREGANVDSGGTLLVEGVDYNVTYATGTLTPIGSWPTDDIFVRYRHRSAPVSPGWGTLSASSAVTDINGKATAIILLDDTLDGELVGLNVDSETPF